MKTVEDPTERPSPNPQDWTTVSGAARMLFVSERTVLRMIEDGRLTGHEFHACRGSRFLWVPDVKALAEARGTRADLPTDASSSPYEVQQCA